MSSKWSNLQCRESAINLIFYDIIHSLPSYELNIERYQPDGNCFVRGLEIEETNLAGVDNMISTLQEGSNCFIMSRLMQDI
jgi:hypothetical protein